MRLRRQSRRLLDHLRLPAEQMPHDMCGSIPMMNTEGPTGSTTVFAAASLTDAFGEMADTFEEETPAPPSN
ncbi:MAG TPA: hypothetical protein VFB74_19130 [Kribbellaceae bacterium]|nr:hypothetical protein [Kribbellaceae bacterium]